MPHNQAAMTVEPTRFHDQSAWRLRTPGGGDAVVLDAGAHCVSWRPDSTGERLFLSDRSAYGEGRAVRGGVPVIFPQFGTFGPGGRHGFARLLAWRRVATGDPHGPDAGDAVWELGSGPETLALWPPAFRTRLRVRLDARSLILELAVRNTGRDPLSFTAALHTYLAVDDIADAALVGLGGVRYRDQVRGGATAVQDADRLVVGGEVDRIYVDAPARLTLDAPGRALGIEQAGFRDTVVWNPWRDKCEALADMPPEGYRRMLCVEAAAIAEPVRLDPDREWRGSQRLTA